MVSRLIPVPIQKAYVATVNSLDYPLDDLSDFRMLARISLSQQICHYILVSDDCDVVGACSGFGAHN